MAVTGGGAGGADGWDPEQYGRFSAEREQPWRDLVGLLQPTGDPVLADLGCGDGRLTALVQERLGATGALGVDRSPAMLAAASGHRASGLRFEQGDIAAFERPGQFDVVLANASLQWVPDHDAVLGRWRASLRRRGQLAVQVPANADHPAHLLAAELGAEVLADPPPDPVAANVSPPEAYCELLDRLGFTELDVLLQVYPHHLASTDEVVEWVKGTTLTRFKEPLGPAGWDQFVEQYRARLHEVLGDRSPYLYTFKRILLWGRLP